MDANGVGALALLLVVLVVDAWIFTESGAREAVGREVFASIGPVTVPHLFNGWLGGAVDLRGPLVSPGKERVASGRVATIYQ